jgi:hypothetical protein
MGQIGAVFWGNNMLTTVSATYEQLIARFWGCKGPVFKLYIPLLYRKLVNLNILRYDGYYCTTVCNKIFISV